jgi:HD-GYP domain-containing protein (c-di-GMP phosphodiesterase class II)
MGLDEDTSEGVYYAGLIHDIGKLYVPAEILSKPGRITALEFEMVKAHPSAGYEILKFVDFPWPISLMVQQHHERIDGSGYPDGIKGADISVEAKILAVADVVEAMTSHRPYRPKLGIEVALDEISQNRGTLFDSAVVDACVKLFTEKGFTLE